MSPRTIGAMLGINTCQSLALLSVAFRTGNPYLTMKLCDTLVEWSKRSDVGARNCKVSPMHKRLSQIPEYTLILPPICQRCYISEKQIVESLAEEAPDYQLDLRAIQKWIVKRLLGEDAGPLKYGERFTQDTVRVSPEEYLDLQSK